MTSKAWRSLLIISFVALGMGWFILPAFAGEVEIEGKGRPSAALVLSPSVFSE